MTYVWHIAKLGDLMKFIIVLVYILYGVCCAAALTKASAGRTNTPGPASERGSESLCPTLRLLQQLFSAFSFCFMVNKNKQLDSCEAEMTFTRIKRRDSFLYTYTYKYCYTLTFWYRRNKEIGLVEIELIWTCAAALHFAFRKS